MISDCFVSKLFLSPHFFFFGLPQRIAGTLPSRTSNAIRWSPRGRHVVLATVGSSTKSELEFWDLDFNSDDRKEGQAEWGSGIQLLGTADHYGVTDVEWDPSGRYLATSASAWTHTVSISFCLNFRSANLKFDSASSRMDMQYGISEVKKLSSTSKIDSSSSSGVHDPQPFCPRKSRN